MISYARPAGLTALVAWALVVGASAGQAPPPVFRSAVDVVLVEVQVVDRAGHPIPGLAPSSFDVRIDGRRRQVVSADLMHYALDPSRASTATTPTSGAVARNDWVPATDLPGRTFVIAIDAVSFSAGEGAGVVRAARGFVDRLAPNDLVGLVTLPRGVTLRPTGNRAAIRNALATVSGLQNMRPNPFHLSASEAMDIVAEMDQASLARMTAGRGAQLVTPMVLRQVQARECQSAIDQGCMQGIAIDADAQARHIEEQVTESISGLKALLALLADLPGRKTVVLMSGGMPVNERAGGWHGDGSEARALGRATATANATVYALHVDVGFRAGQNAETRIMRPAVSIARDRELQQRLLSDFAASSGGALIEAPTDAGEGGLSRVLLESSAFYALGVTPEARDLDGRPHELRVSLTDKGTNTLRSPRFVVLRRGR
jgi:VWFA-related protein